MRFDPPLVKGRLLRRYRRFLADVELADGRIVTAHCANPGSMKSLLTERAAVWLSSSDNPKRKLAYTWELVRVGRHYASVNTLRTNSIVGEALAAGRIPEFAGYERIRPEAPMGERRRVDFLLSRPGEVCYLEVKNVTLAEGTTALFPDSVTERGRAHLEELARRKRSGDRAAMIYVVNRGDCDRAGPACAIDPAYAETLVRVHAEGVEAIAYRTKVGPSGISISHRVPFLVGGDAGSESRAG
jgi:sugar fermentation stimulation protein A